VRNQIVFYHGWISQGRCGAPCGRMEINYGSPWSHSCFMRRKQGRKIPVAITRGHLVNDSFPAWQQRVEMFGWIVNGGSTGFGDIPGLDPGCHQESLSTVGRALGYDLCDSDTSSRFSQCTGWLKLMRCGIEIAFDTDAFAALSWSRERLCWASPSACPHSYVAHKLTSSLAKITRFL